NNRCAPGTTTSNTAMLPAEFSPVTRNRISSGPRRIVSSAGLIATLLIWCAILTSFANQFGPDMPGEEARVRTWTGRDGSVDHVFADRWRCSRAIESWLKNIPDETLQARWRSKNQRLQSFRRNF